MATITAPVPTITKRRKKYVPAVGPRLKKLLAVIFCLFAVLTVNSVYLGSVSLLEWRTGLTYQNYFYQLMFLAHLLLGVLLAVPTVIFGVAHLWNAYNWPNRRAVKVGIALFATCLILIASGVVLTRLENVIVVKDPAVRSIAYWAHVISPLVIVWLFILHRLAGRRIRWKTGVTWGLVAAAFAVGMTLLHTQDPRKWNQVGPASGAQYFLPALSRTSDGNFIPKEILNNDAFCAECHPDIHREFSHSAHKFSSFNNPAYLFSVLNTRKVMFERDGNVHGSRFCAACHDPVPFFSGEFDKRHFDDPNYDLANDPSAQAGITCTTCHAITHINSPKGNGAFTIEEPLHYPFTFSDNKWLRWINRQLIKAKPDFHKKTFLKPLHKSPEFCGSCHKVHLPEALNAYKWLRGQNHYDAYHLSGVSGHGITSFYYPPKAENNCNGCHMKPLESADFGARPLDDSGLLKVHDHQFPSANTAIPHLTKMPESAIEKHKAFNEGVMRLDIFGVKEGGTIDRPLIAPVRPSVPALTPGRPYLLETVIRTVKMGHMFTQGTADSNEVWLDVTVTSGDRVIGRSGGLNPADREVDPWSHFVNAFMIDRTGRRIDRRNAEDIFIALYNHQIPPGAADVVHYLLNVPEDVTEPIVVDIKLQYRKFDTLYMKFFQAAKFVTNDLPIMTLATDRVVLLVEGRGHTVENPPSPIVEWQRWNDYGIGLLNKGDSGPNRGELRQAEAAFAEVSRLGRPDGSLNQARVYIKEGRLADAVAALKQAAAHDPPAPQWSIAWFTGIVNKQNGHLDEAIENFRAVLSMKDTAECRERGFDFSQDYRVLDELGQTLFDRAKQERGESRKEVRMQLLLEARSLFEKALEYDPEYLSAHYNLGLIYAALGDAGKAKHHREEHAKYRPDDNSRDKAIAAARMKYPAANSAAESIVIYDLQRDGAYGLPPRNPVAAHTGSAATARTDNAVTARNSPPYQGGAGGGSR